MKLWAHSAAALPLAAGLWWAGMPAGAVAAAAGASVLVDLDHLPDYVYWRRGWGGVADFFRSNHQRRTSVIFILLHSWELLGLALAACWLAGAPAWGWGLCLGWAYHLVWDQLSNHVPGAFYFLGYRFRRGFVRSRLFPSG